MGIFHEIECALGLKKKPRRRKEKGEREYKRKRRAEPRGERKRKRRTPPRKKDGEFKKKR